ncbi:Hypothetical predicted protein [Pelobates cultripes]|uniref:Uncharacterized protein n=1 Tax=Pelobates cultripes TaxID=61616 RepID=A0AAD1RI68_PELCU|nr:Hypothetical predicted protein [Pelobates cultripes]
MPLPLLPHRRSPDYSDSYSQHVEPELVISTMEAATAGPSIHLLTHPNQQAPQGQSRDRRNFGHQCLQCSSTMRLLVSLQESQQVRCSQVYHASDHRACMYGGEM